MNAHAKTVDLIALRAGMYDFMIASVKNPRKFASQEILAYLGVILVLYYH